MVLHRKNGEKEKAQKQNNHEIDVQKSFGLGILFQARQPLQMLVLSRTLGGIRVEPTEPIAKLLGTVATIFPLAATILTEIFLFHVDGGVLLHFLVGLTQLLQLDFLHGDMFASNDVGVGAGDLLHVFVLVIAHALVKSRPVGRPNQLFAVDRLRYQAI